MLQGKFRLLGYEPVLSNLRYPGRLAKRIRRKSGWTSISSSLWRAARTGRPSDNVIALWVARLLKMATTCSGALSASSIMMTRPNVTARRRGESVYLITPPVVDVVNINWLTVVSRWSWMYSRGLPKSLYEGWERRVGWDTRYYLTQSIQYFLVVDSPCLKELTYQ